MTPLPPANNSIAQKYCGGGWGGYALYLFKNSVGRDQFVAEDKESRRAIEPYLISG